MSPDRDYVLGTHDDEVVRLGLQHRVWRPRALDAWRRAGFTTGQRLLDIGCGPGFATLDLAEIAGPTGEVLAFDRSSRFLDVLQESAARRGLTHIRTFEADLDQAALPDARAAGAWVRWVLAFVKQPRELLRKIHGALAPGGALVIHEYFDYSTWRVSPRSADFEEFVRVVMRTWRESGGEPDIGLELPRWLEEVGFEIRSLQTIVDVISPSNFVWEWPKTFVEVGVQRLVGLGAIDAAQADRIRKAFAASEATPGALMVTPGVLEVVAKKSR